MGNIIKLSETGPLSENQLSKYEKAKKTMLKAGGPHSIIRHHLTEGVFLNVKSNLESLIKTGIAKGTFLRDENRDGQIIEAIGTNYLQEYLDMTKEILRKIENADTVRQTTQYPEEAEIVKKYEYRYNRFHRKY